MTEQQHETEVGKHAPALYRATCTCGWVGDFKPDAGMAENDAADHVVAATPS